MASRTVRLTIDFFVVAAIAALVVLPWDMWFTSKISLSSMSLPPSWSHPFGTDNLGRDLLVRSSEALRYAVAPLWGGVVVATIGGLLAATGALLMRASRAGHKAVAPLQIGATILASVPIGIVAFTWAVWWESGGLLPVLFSLMALFAVRVFLQTMDLFEQDRKLGYWDAHSAMGGTVLTRIWRYGLCGTWKWRLLDGVGFHLRAAVAIEASLSYLGFGIQEPTASFGNMLASHFDSYLKGDFTSLIVIVVMLSLAAGFPASLLSALNALRPNASRRSKRTTNLDSAPVADF